MREELKVEHSLYWTKRKPALRKRRKAAPTSRRMALGPSERAMPAIPTTSYSRAFAAN